MTPTTKLTPTNLAYIITLTAFGLIILLALTNNPHTECDGLLNANSLPLATIQENCYKYLNF